MLLSAGDAQQRIDGDLEHRHPDTDDEQRDEGHLISGMKRKADGAERRADEGADHDRLFRVALDQKSGGDGHDTVGDEEGKDQEAGGAHAGREGADDVRDDGAEDVAEQRDDEEHKKDEANQEPVPRHECQILFAKR